MEEERAGEGVDHLQAAARELIEAARAFLDVADDLVSDPKVAEGLLSGIGGLADTAREAARDAARRAAGFGPGAGGADGEGPGGTSGGEGGEDGDDEGFQHIPVS